MAKKTSGQQSKSGALSTLGQSAEKLLKELVEDMARDVKANPTGEARRYQLLDQMRVIDRINKLEAIRAKMEDDEGGFFDEPEEGAD